MSRSERRRSSREGGSDMRKLYIVLGAVAVIGIGAVGYSVGSAGGSAVSEPIELEGMDDLERLVELAQGVPKGDENAEITIIEFGDYQCPSCQQFALQVEPSISLGLLEPGKARFVFYDWPIVTAHPNAFLAARAARCAGDQGDYWAYHDILYRNQTRWAPLTSPEDTFADYAAEVGLNKGAFESCLNSDKFADVVTANMQLGLQLGVNGTPTVLVEHKGQARGVAWNDYSAISEHVNGLLEASEGGAQ